jgi:hypothetical protein
MNPDKDKMQVENFKYLEGMKLVMGYKESDGYAYLTGTDEKGVTYELTKIKI